MTGAKIQCPRAITDTRLAWKLWFSQLGQKWTFWDSMVQIETNPFRWYVKMCMLRVNHAMVTCLLVIRIDSITVCLRTSNLRMNEWKTRTVVFVLPRNRVSKNAVFTSDLRIFTAYGQAGSVQLNKYNECLTRMCCEFNQQSDARLRDRFRIAILHKHWLCGKDKHADWFAAYD